MKAASSKPRVVPDLYLAFANGELSLENAIWEQQRFHEHRRWSTVDMLDSVDIPAMASWDRAHVWNAARGELTTKPGADRLARLCDSEGRRWIGTDDTLAAVLQACGTWSRYWNEEEAHHETVFGELSRRIGGEPIDDRMILEYRQIFPDDDMIRTLILLAISEIKATVLYSTVAAGAQDEGLRTLFRQVAADESQHMQYFVSFARALITSGRYATKDVLAIAHLFVREGGELEGSRRKNREARGTHVNWWDALSYGEDAPEDPARLLHLTLGCVRQVTGLALKDAQDLEEQWMEAVG